MNKHLRYQVRLIQYEKVASDSAPFLTTQRTITDSPAKGLSLLYPLSFLKNGEWISEGCYRLKGLFFMGRFEDLTNIYLLVLF